MTTTLTITKRAACQDCGGPLAGGTRLQGGCEREAWAHIEATDQIRHGLHTAFPKADTIVETT